MTAVGLTPESAESLACSVDRTIRIWPLALSRSPTSKDGAKQISIPETTSCLLYSKNTAGVLLWSSANKVQMYRAPNSSQDIVPSDQRITCFAFCSNGLILCGGPSGLVEAYEVSSKVKKASDAYVRHDSQVSCMALSSDSQLLASSSTTGQLLLTSLKDKKLISITAANVSKTAIQWSSVTPKMLAWSCSDGCVQVIDVSQRVEPLHFKPGHQGSATCLSFSHSAPQVIFTSGLDGQVLVWDVRTGKATERILMSSGLTCLDARDDGMHLAVGSVAGEVMITDLRMPSIPMDTLDTGARAPIQSIAWKPRGRSSSSSGRPSKSSSASKSTTSSQQTPPVAQTANGAQESGAAAVERANVTVQPSSRTAAVAGQQSNAVPQPVQPAGVRANSLGQPSVGAAKQLSASVTLPTGDSKAGPKAMDIDNNVRPTDTSALPRSVSSSMNNLPNSNHAATSAPPTATTTAPAAASSTPSMSNTLSATSSQPSNSVQSMSGLSDGIGTRTTEPKGVLPQGVLPSTTSTSNPSPAPVTRRATSSTPTSRQHDSALLDEVMATRDDVHSLHFDMMKQFHLQMVQVMQAVDTMTSRMDHMEESISEVRRLLGAVARRA